MRDIKLKVKVKCSRYRPGVAQRVGRGIAVLFHDRGTRRWVSGQQHAPAALYPRGKFRCPLYRRLGGSQGRSGQERKISSPPGFDPPTVQPVVSHYTTWATRRTHCMYNELIRRRATRYRGLDLEFGNREVHWDVQRGQDRRLNYKRNNQVSSYNRCWCGNSMGITQPDCVCVCVCVFVPLGIQHATRMRHIAICGLPHSTSHSQTTPQHPILRYLVSILFSDILSAFCSSTSPLLPIPNHLPRILFTNTNSVSRSQTSPQYTIPKKTQLS